MASGNIANPQSRTIRRHASDLNSSRLNIVEDEIQIEPVVRVRLHYLQLLIEADLPIF
jgi:hypothetical protein